MCTSSHHSGDRYNSFNSFAFRSVSLENMCHQFSPKIILFAISAKSNCLIRHSFSLTVMHLMSLELMKSIRNGLSFATSLMENTEAEKMVDLDSFSRPKKENRIAQLKISFKNICAHTACFVILKFSWLQTT